MRPRRDMQKEMLNAMPTDLPLVKPGMGMITVSFKFFVPDRYRKTRLTASQCARPGFSEKRDRMDMA